MAVDSTAARAPVDVVGCSAGGPDDMRPSS